jgi:hypothetical protein
MIVDWLAAVLPQLSVYLYFALHKIENATVDRRSSGDLDKTAVRNGPIERVQRCGR